MPTASYRESVDAIMVAANKLCDDDVFVVNYKPKTNSTKKYVVERVFPISRNTGRRDAIIRSMHSILLTVCII